MYMIMGDQLQVSHAFVTGFAKTWHNVARIEIHFIA